MRKINLPTLPPLAVLIAGLVVTSPCTFAIDALSPVERFLGSAYDAAEYSDLDIDQEKRFAPASPADSDLGDQLILKRYDNSAPVRFDLSTQLFWTDNTASTNSQEEDGIIWQSRLRASWQPRIGNNLFLNLAASQDVYRYDSPGSLDFERTDLRAGLIKTAPDFFDILFFARYEYTRVTSGSLSDGIYGAHRIRAGAHKMFLSTAKHSAYVALDAAHNLNATPGLLERNEYSAHLGYTYQITDKLRAALYYHFAYYDYGTGGREDYNHVIGTELYWQVSRSTRLHASLTYVQNDSNLPAGAADYDSIQGGLGIGFTTRF